MKPQPQKDTEQREVDEEQVEAQLDSTADEHAQDDEQNIATEADAEAQEDQVQQEEEMSNTQQAQSLSPNRTLGLFVPAYDTLQIAGPRWHELPEKEKAMAVRAADRDWYVREFRVAEGAEPDKTIDVQDFETRFFLWPDIELLQSQWMVQGPAPGDLFKAGTWHQRRAIPLFPTDILVGYSSPLAALTRRLTAGAKPPTPWTAEKSAAARGAMLRLNTELVFASAELMGAGAFVGFPGSCESELKPLSAEEVDVVPLIADAISEFNACAIVYVKDATVVPSGKEKGPIGYAPRYATVYRCVTTTAQLQDMLVMEREAGLGRDVAAECIANIEARIEALQSYDNDLLIDFYVYRTFDEASTGDNVAQLFDLVITKPEDMKASASAAEYLNSNIRTLIKNNNYIQFTIGWGFAFGDENLIGYAQVQLPMIPDAAYKALVKTFGEQAMQPKPKKETQARISAAATEEAVLNAQPRKTLKRVEFDPVEHVEPAKKMPHTAAYAELATALAPTAAAPQKPAIKKSTPMPIIDDDENDKNADDDDDAETIDTQMDEPIDVASPKKSIAAKAPAATTKAATTNTITKPSAAADAAATKLPPAAKAAVANAATTAAEKTPVFGKMPIKMPIAAVPKKEVAEPAATAHAPIKTTAVTQVPKQNGVPAATEQPTSTLSMNTSTQPTTAPQSVVKRSAEKQELLDYLCKISTRLTDPENANDEELRYRIWQGLKTTNSKEYETIDLDEPITTFSDAAWEVVAALNWLEMPTLILDACAREKQIEELLAKIAEQQLKEQQLKEQALQQEPPKAVIKRKKLALD